MVPEAPVGSRVGNIRVVRKLGAGGMGEVYLGFDETLQREVALKAIAGRQRLRGDARARFVREARMLSQLDHPNICRIYDFIEDGESEYLVLELINGRELGEAVASGLEPREKLRIARDVAGVLAAAHEKGIVHRDLKPGNVMLTSENEVKVLDFGLARSEDGNTAADVRLERRSLGEASEATDAGKPDCPTLETRFDPGSRSTEPVGDTTVAAVVGSDEPTLDEKTVGDAVRFRTKRGMVVGTPHFMSPEQARGEPVTTASDMYSFGLLVQSLSTGTSPYPDGLSVEEVLELAKQGETLALAGADVDLARLVGRLKSPALAARPTAATTYERLEWILAKPKRRIRRLAAAALVLVAALAGLKYTVDLGHERNLAVEAREVAERRRGQAEDLIGFMLGDLREKLTPVGRLEILDEVGEQAMEYFAAVPEQELTDRELLSRSRALSQIGDVRMEQGSFPAANKAFEQSLALTRGLVARDPENAEWQVELGASHFWIGYVDLQLGELDEALHHFQTYYEISARLLEQQPDNPKWQLEVAYGHNNLARVLDRQGRPVQALEHYKASVGIRELLFAGDPESAGPKRDLANSQSVLGDALKSARQWPEAVQALEDSLEIRRSLLDADPEHTGWQSDLALSHSKLGKLRLERGEIAQALDHFEENLRLVSVLVSRDSANTRWRRNLAVAEFWLGRVDLARERLEPASSRFDRAEEILLGLLSAEAGELDWQLDLASVRLARGAASLAGGDTSTSEGEAESVVALLEPLSSNGSRVSGVAPRMAEALLLRASAELHESAQQEAATSLRRARETIEPVARDLQQPWLLAVLARVLLLQERVQEARPILSELSRIGYREPEFVRLCRDLGKAAECGHGG